MKEISYPEFEKVDLRVGTIIRSEEFPQARAPAYILQVDFGEEIGVLKSSARITDRYQRLALIDKQVIAVTNFPAKQIGPMRSECLICGFYDENGGVVLAVPDAIVPNGAKMC